MFNLRSSKIKQSYSIKPHKHTSTKIFSILLAIILVTTVFSSITPAKEEKVYTKNDITEVKYNSDSEPEKTSSDGDATPKATFRNLLKFFDRIRNGISPFYIVTKLNENDEKRTRMRLLLPTSIDVDGDSDNDIRVWSFRLPSVDLRPPAVAIKTYLIVRRLPGMKDIKNDAFEIYLEYTPKILSELIGEPIGHIRIGYQSPKGEEIPRTCIVTHKTIPHFLYPRKKTTHKVAINPGFIAGKEQLNLLFSIAAPRNETNPDTFELLLLVNHSPAVKNKIVLNRYKEKFLGRAQTLEISRKDVKSKVSILIKQLMSKNASLSIENIPNKLTISWLFAKTGYIDLNTHENDLGKVEFVFDDTLMLGFVPKKGIYGRIGWHGLGLKSFTQQRNPFNVSFDAHASLEVSDFYVIKPKLKPFGMLPYNLELTASYISLDLGIDVDVGKLTISISLTYESIIAKVKDIDVAIENLSINLEDTNNSTIGVLSSGDNVFVFEDDVAEGSFNVPYIGSSNPANSAIDTGKDADGSLNLPHSENLEFNQVQYKSAIKEDIEDDEGENRDEETKTVQMYFRSITLSDGILGIYLDRTNLIYSGEIGGSLQIDNFDISVIETIAIYIGDMVTMTQIETTGSFSSFEVSGTVYLSLSLQDQPTTFSAFIDGHLKLIDLNFDGTNKSIKINLINISGDSSISTLPHPENTVTYFGLKYGSTGGFVEISGVTSTGEWWLDLLDMLDHVYFCGNGDIQVEIWKDSEQDTHLYLESQKGLTLDLFKIEFDHGIIYKIERSGSLQGHIGPGHVHATFDIDGDGDGYVFLDSSEIEFEDVLLSYWRSGIISKGIRFSPSINYIDADLFLLQWDSITLGSSNTTIPYNWYLTGKISIGIDIDIFVGNEWYDLWPLENYGSGGTGDNSNPYEAPAGNGNSPPDKPQKPVGPPGNPVIGRVVKGNNYTYTTIATDPDEDQIHYKWDWGDGTISDWSVALSSGVGTTGTHIWTETGTYQIRVKVKNIYGEESDWSDPFGVTVRNPLGDQQYNQNQYENNNNT